MAVHVSKQEGPHGLADPAVNGRVAALRQLIAQSYRFIVIGLLNNGVTYSLYLLLTWWGLGATTAMTITALIGLVISFIGNRNWTFKHDSKSLVMIGRFLTVYAIGYVVNYLILWWFVDHLHWSHAWVQLGAISLIAAFTFVCMRLWVFKAGAPAENTP